MSNELRVRQAFLGGVVDDNPLTSGATTLTSSSLAAMSVIGSTKHLAVTLDPAATAGAPEIVYVTAHTASATTATILRGQEGTTARSHAQNIPWLHAPTVRDFAPAGRLARASKTNGDTTANSTSYAVLDSALDLTVTAQAGDILELTLEVIVGGRNSGTFADNMNWTAYTRVSAADVNNVAGAGTASVTAWFTPDTLWTVDGTTSYVVQSGDVSGGAVTLRLKYRTDDATSGRTIYSNSTNPLNWRVKNLGAQEA